MAIREIMKQRSFRLLWLSELVSVLGDQFTMLALPWLVLQITGSPFAMGIVFAVMGVPRAIFMLIGGATTDRYSPRFLIIVTNIIRMALVGILGALVILGQNEMWLIYGFALLFGLADAFFYPAISAILPQVVIKEQLEPANAVIQGTAHLSSFVGPAVAGTVIAFFAQKSADPNPGESTGVGVALLIDAATFFLSALLIWGVRTLHAHERNDSPFAEVVAEIIDGIRFAWSELTRRTVFLGLIGITLLINAPLAIGLPVFAHQRLAEGAAGLGAISAAWGLGAVFGNAVAGGFSRPAAAVFGPIVFLSMGVSGVGVAALSFFDDVYSACAILFVVGTFDGYVIVQLMSWFQRTTPEELMGRMMSLMMFAMVGLTPVTEIAFGALIEQDLGLVMLVSGVAMALFSGVLAATPGIRNMGWLEGGS